jgi:uncharacterized protein YchJ
MSNQIYSTCLADEQWVFIKGYFPKTNDFGETFQCGSVKKPAI